MSRHHLLIFNGAVLTGCAVFDYAWRTTLLTSLMLLLPFLDKTWPIPDLHINKNKLKIWTLVTMPAILLIASNPNHATNFISTLLFTALPEEWFFRSYLMQQLEPSLIFLRKPAWTLTKHQKCNITKSFTKYIDQKFSANIVTSILFALLHIPTQGWFGILVFFPSTAYGWIYQKTNDIILVILLHALSNIIFVSYIRDMIA